MQWSKIKNIVILLLVVVDLLLLGQVAYRELESDNLRRQAREEAAALLAASGVQVDLSALPGDPSLLPMRCERDSAREGELAAALLGADAALQSDGSYTSPLGRLWFYSSGDFDLELAGGAIPLGDLAPERLALQVLEKLDFQAQVLSSTQEGETLTLRVCQLWEDVPVFSCEASLVFQEGSLRSVRGRRLPGTPVAVSGDSLMTVTTTLVRFLSALTEGGYVRSQVRGMTAGYEMTAVPTSSTFRLTPVWQIDTDASPFRLSGQGTLTEVSD